MDPKVKVIKFHCDGVCEVKFIDNTCEAFLGEVGGMYEVITVWKLSRGRSVVAIGCHDGKERGFLKNSSLPGFYGDVLVCCAKSGYFSDVDNCTVARVRAQVDGELRANF